MGSWRLGRLRSACRSSALVLAGTLTLAGPAGAAPASTNGCAAPRPLSQLSGTWQAEALAHSVGGVGRSLQNLALQVSDDGAVRGHRDWQVLDRGVNAAQGRNRKGEAVSANRESVLGLVNPSSCRVLLVEDNDMGSLSGWLRLRQDQPVLELEATQSGKGAVVFFASFRKLNPTSAVR